MHFPVGDSIRGLQLPSSRSKGGIPDLGGAAGNFLEESPKKNRTSKGAWRRSRARSNPAFPNSGTPRKDIRRRYGHHPFTKRKSRRNQAALPYGGPRSGGGFAARLHANVANVEAAHSVSRREIHRDRAGPARYRRFGYPCGWPGYENLSDSHPCARQITGN